jgi:hypothetical protein
VYTSRTSLHDALINDSQSLLAPRGNDIVGHKFAQTAQPKPIRCNWGFGRSGDCHVSASV